MLDRLHLDLSPDELKRVWHMILKESGEAEAATGIHLNGFRHGVKNVAFLRHMVINLKEVSGPEVQQYVVPASGAKGPPLHLRTALHLPPWRLGAPHCASSAASAARLSSRPRWQAAAIEHQVSADYDYDRSTNDNYRVAGTQPRPRACTWGRQHADSHPRLPWPVGPRPRRRQGAGEQGAKPHAAYDLRLLCKIGGTSRCIVAHSPLHVCAGLAH